MTARRISTGLIAILATLALAGFNWSQAEAQDQPAGLPPPANAWPGASASAWKRRNNLPWPTAS